MEGIDFKELTKDESFMNKMQQFDSSIDQIKNFLTNFNDEDFYDNLSNQDKIKFNLLMSYALNSLFWMYLRAEGADPNTNQIKAENERLRQAMIRAKQVSDKSLMPRVNKDVVQRFVRSSLFDLNKKKDQCPPEEGGIIEENWES